MWTRKVCLFLVMTALASPAWATSPDAAFTTTLKTATSAGVSATDVALWTPTSGNFFVLMGCIVSTNGAGTIELEVSDVDVIPPQYFQTAGTRVLGFGAYPLSVSAKDAVLTYTHTRGEWSIYCSGYEGRE